MLTQSDLTKIGNLLDQKLDKKLEEKLEQKLEEKLEKFRKSIYTDIAEFIQDSLIRIMDRHEDRLVRLEKHTNHPPGSPM